MANREDLTVAPFHEQLRQLDPYEFEQFVADLWSLQGWETTVSQQSSDRGIDIIATKSQPIEQKHVLQVKRYGDGNTVGSQAVQQYSSLRQQEPGTDMVVIITTSDFTRQAQELADQLNVKLVNGPELSQLIEQVDAETLVAEYMDNGQTTQVETPGTNTTATDSQETMTDETSEEMGTVDALLAVIQLLLILGVFGYVLFYLVTHFVL